MISLYSGTPGSGKSLHVADRLLWALHTRHLVVCNFDINPEIVNTRKRDYYRDYFRYVPNNKLSVSRLIRFAEEYFDGNPIKEGRLLLVVDEAQLMFNAREWDKVGRKQWTAFFSQHRKYGYDIILVAQFDRMLDRQIRSLIEYEYIHRKVSNYGWKGVFLSALMLSPHLFAAVKMWYPMGEKVGAELFKYKRKYGKLYDTYMSFDV